jgi:hypothetical protein
VLLYPMIHHAGAQGAAQLVLLVECVVTGAMALYLWRQWRLKKDDDKKIAPAISMNARSLGESGIVKILK